MKPPLAITMGDPAGVGPEIIVKACRRLADRLRTGDLRLLVIGSVPALRREEASLGGDEIPEVTAAGPWPAVGILSAGSEQAKIAPGVLSAAAGRMAYLAVEQGVRLALAGRVGAIVTAPLNKEALNLAGYRYAGHTDLLASLTGSAGSVMLLAHKNMRVSHLTTHIPLQEVSAKLTPSRLRTVIELTHRALLDLGVSAPTIAACVAAGLDIVGPVPGDTVFVKLRAGQYDAVVAMYHDQGHIPVKLLGFQVDPTTGRWDSLSGVNITLGLPIIRTSVDHGTAFDIAGQGRASETSLVEAIEYAEKLASPAS